MQLHRRHGLRPSNGGGALGGVRRAGGLHALERLADAFDLPSERLAVLTPGRSLPTVAVTNDNDRPPSLTEAGGEGSRIWHSCRPTKARGRSNLQRGRGESR